jgi:TPR repeat protein
MKRLMLALAGCWLLCPGTWAQSASGASAPDSLDEQLLSEQKQFVECLSCFYSPAWWLSYNDCLCFQPRSEAQVKQLEAMNAAVAGYLALTNRETRHDLAARLLAASGVSKSWQRMLWLPFSATNQDLTPTLAKPVRVIPKYKMLQLLGSGDALIQDGASTCFVMDFGRGADDASRTNALLIKEGVKTYSAGGGFKTVEAFADVALSKEETAALNRVAAALQKEAAALGQELANSKARQEFAEYQARATDSSPYLEYLLAKAYLEGKGTEKDERLGLEWMNKAARNGSGDARSYLEGLGRSAAKPQPK